MKMSSITAPVLLAAALAAGGCYTPQPTTLYRSDKLPDKHWYELSDSDSRVEALPAALRSSLVQQRQLVDTESAKDGTLSAQTNKEVAELLETTVLITLLPKELYLLVQTLLRQRLLFLL